MMIGCISYINTRPFFYDWSYGDFPVLKGTPRELGEAARRDEIIAGPLPISICWELEDKFEPLEWGIAVRENSRSVFLLSRRPLAQLERVKIGLTNDSQASVRLLAVLIENKYGHRVDWRRGFSDDDEAWLTIGDQALKFGTRPSAQWPVVTDLAHEWWTWQKMPFVFARWIVRKDLEQRTKIKLKAEIERSLARGLASLPSISEEDSQWSGLPAGLIESYLRGFTYEFGSEEEKSISLFRSLAEKTNSQKILQIGG